MTAVAVTVLGILALLAWVLDPVIRPTRAPSPPDASSQSEAG